MGEYPDAQVLEGSLARRDGRCTELVAQAISTAPSRAATSRARVVECPPSAATPPCRSNSGASVAPVARTSAPSINHTCRRYGLSRETSQRTFRQRLSSPLINRQRRLEERKKFSAPLVSFTKLRQLLPLLDIARREKTVLQALLCDLLVERAPLRAALRASRDPRSALGPVRRSRPPARWWTGGGRR